MTESISTADRRVVPNLCAVMIVIEKRRGDTRTREDPVNVTETRTGTGTVDVAGWRGVALQRATATTTARLNTTTDDITM